MFDDLVGVRMGIGRRHSDGGRAPAMETEMGDQGFAESGGVATERCGGQVGGCCDFQAQHCLVYLNQVGVGHFR